MNHSPLRTVPRSALLIVVPLIATSAPAIAMSTAGANIAGTAPPALSATHSTATSRPPAPPPPTGMATMGSGSVALSRLHALLDVSDTPPNAVRAQRSAGHQPRVDWFLDTTLLESDGYARAVQAYRSGLPVAVIRGSTGNTMVDTAIQGVFGVASKAALAVYHRAPDGGLQVFSVAEVPADASARSQVAATLIDAISPAVVLPRGARSTRQTPGQLTAAGIERAALPRLMASVTEVSTTGNGASVTLVTEVLRDTGRDYDVLAVTSSSTHNLKPHHNGLSAGAVIVPDTYRYWQTLTTLDNSGTTPKPTQMAPASSAATDLIIGQDFVTRTSYAFGLSREVSAGVEGKVPQAGAKMGATFDFTREYTSTNRLSFSIKDYAIAAGITAPSSQSRRSMWELPLAASISHAADYFGRSPSPARMTPSMHQVTASGATTWIVPGAFAGTLNVLAGGSISNRSFRGRSVETIPDPRPQPTATTLIRADSPYLTRETTVFIQSRAGNGGCLRDNGGVVGIAACPDSSHPGWMDDLHAQWQLDTHGRYYNRGSKQCMQILTQGISSNSGGEVITARCSLGLDQRWEWQADRIHSLHGDGYPDWRLHVSNQRIEARTSGKPELQRLPSNPFHALLAPWSTYPRKPDSTAFIPKLDNLGPSQPVSDEVKALNPPLPQERWELIILRQGLHR